MLAQLVHHGPDNNFDAAIVTFSDAQAVRYQHDANGTRPAVEERQRHEDARVILEAARRAYFGSPETSN
jgi:hypothetical protein